ncbi:hypothetical protein [Georgenia sp. SUBG003]|uniref:hypothetical protein n=1 Tax=Georgenia sp. SUBG003 TaxID=1497974 RepID=UPI003AB1EC8F
MAPLQDSTITLGSDDYPTYPEQRTYSFRAQVLDLSGQNVVVKGGIRKFVDTLPMVGGTTTNNLGQVIPVAVPTPPPTREPTTTSSSSGSTPSRCTRTCPGRRCAATGRSTPPTARPPYHYLGPRVLNIKASDVPEMSGAGDVVLGTQASPLAVSAAQAVSSAALRGAGSPGHFPLITLLTPSVSQRCAAVADQVALMRSERVGLNAARFPQGWSCAKSLLQ